jgi:LAO/AO transport system kinase
MTETGISELSEAISKHAEHNKGNNRMNFLLAERAYTLIQKNRMKSVSVVALKNEIELLRNQDNFNLYSFIQLKLEN